MATEKKYVETPLMKQYYSIKAVHPDAILLFRVGDFYETFGEDAIEASAILGITLTRRANGAATFVELAGFPFHAVDTYLPKLVRAGKRVAICEQLEDPKLVKGLVKRGVIELVTPGVILDDNIIEKKENVYLASVFFGRESTGVAFLDVSTGEFFVAEGDDAYVEKLLAGFSPKEIVYQRGCEQRFVKSFGSNYYTYRLDDWVFSYDVNVAKLCEQFHVSTLKGFGVDHFVDGISAAGSILYYLEFTEHHNIAHISSISRIDRDDYMWIDKFTIRNLELFSSNASRGTSFIEVIDRTRTPMGGRLLRRWVALPLLDLSRIKARQDVVETLVSSSQVREEISDSISNIGDLERMCSRVASLRILPRELIQLKNSLHAIAGLKDILSRTESACLTSLSSSLEVIDELEQRIAHDITPDPATNQIQKGGIIAKGVSHELDELREVSTGGKDIINSIQQRESERTGIPSLKVGFNNVFGYYIEVRNTHKDKVPEDWIRKQTLKDAERYITEELKSYEERIIGAESRILELEQQIYSELMEFASGYIERIQKDAHVVATLDCLCSFALQAVKYGYCRPDVNDSYSINLVDARHPVIETLLKVGEEYIPNDVNTDVDGQQILMITGPNMSGKSALLRQTAIITLMAQMGSFVPAKSASIGLVDKIFTRVGATDNISQGESTFMVEMLESACILNNISRRSLVLLDEIGRGTSTYDGISIAWAMVEFLHNHSTAHPRTLFATHYHELNEMENICERVHNFHVSVKEVDGTVVFLRKLEKGGTEHSFGIHVAKLAGMPREVVDRAMAILQSLEQVYGNGEIVPSGSLRNRGKKSRPSDVRNAVEQAQPSSMQLSMFQLDDPVLIQIRDAIKGLDINNLTPIEALNKLNEIKNITGL